MKSKVSIARCDSYEPAEVKVAVKTAVDLIGGMGSFVKRPCRVLIKPNLLSARPPEEGVCTHPEFVRTVVQLVKEAGGIPAIGDSPGSFFTIKSIDEVYAKSGMKKIADEERIKLVRFDKIIHINGYPIARALKEFDLVINLPKLKTHTLTILTGAVKNLFGFMPGLNKAQCHKRAPNIREFSRILADIFSITKPRLSVMDGIVGMDGDGPAAGRVRKCGLVLASSDAVGLDAIFAGIVNFPYSENALLREVVNRNLGKGRLEDIDIVGEDLDSCRIKDFRLPQTELIYRFPSWFSKPLARFLNFRPVINEKLCEKCNICRDTCPIGAIAITKEVSKINRAKCIKCFCCHEVCPYDAIYIKKNIFAKRIWG